MANNEGTRYRANTGYHVEEDRASWQKKKKRYKEKTTE
jgi:hypothetical protein